MLICQDQRNDSGCGARLSAGTAVCPHCGHSLRYALEVHDPGARIGAYRIVRDIGVGSFGAVYEAEDMRQPGLLVALKETIDPAHIRRFEGEFAVLCRLRHDHLPRYYEVFEAGGNGYLVMELVSGQSLADILERRNNVPLIEAQVLGYALQVCDALNYLHQQTPPILHRDIKPANIRLTPEGLIKLVDFGLFKQGGDKTRSSRMELTPAYAPLEQYGGGSNTLPQSDIYSLGATLYHLLTGDCPPTVAERLARMPDPLQPPQQHNPRLTPHVSHAVMQAMAIYPQHRYLSADAFKAALLPTNPPPVASLATTVPVAMVPQVAPARTLPAAPDMLPFVWRWALANTASWAGWAGWSALIVSLIHVVEFDVLFGILFGALFGAIVGRVQWLVLRRWLPDATRWALASAVGGAFSEAASNAVFALAGMASVLVFALVFGSAQWLVLRRYVPRASWWLLASAVGMAVGMALIGLVSSTVTWAVDATVNRALLGGAVGGLVYGLLTAPVLVWLLRRS